MSEAEKREAVLEWFDNDPECLRVMFVESGSTIEMFAERLWDDELYGIMDEDEIAEVMRSILVSN